MILSQYHIFELDTINIYSAGFAVLFWNCEGLRSDTYIDKKLQLAINLKLKQ
jgi:hypothetical protein